MKRILVLLLALCTIATFAFACGKEATEETTAPINAEEFTSEEDITVEETSAIEDTSLAEDASTVEASTGGVTTAVTSAGETTAATTTAAEGVKTPEGTAAIVAFYNDAANATKSQKNFTAVKSDKLDCHITEGVLKIVDSALNDLRKDKPNQKEVFVNGKSDDTTPQKFLPVGGESYMSKLQPAWVKSATCTKNSNGTFTVKLSLKEETFKAKTEDPVHHRSCMDTLDVDWGGLPFKVHDDTKGRNHDATITAVVTADGKLLKELHIYEPVEVKGQVQVGFWSNLTVEGYWKQDIKFS